LDARLAIGLAIGIGNNIATSWRMFERKRSGCCLSMGKTIKNESGNVEKKIQLFLKSFFISFDFLA